MAGGVSSSVKLDCWSPVKMDCAVLWCLEGRRQRSPVCDACVQLNRLKIESNNDQSRCRRTAEEPQRRQRQVYENIAEGVWCKRPPDGHLWYGCGMRRGRLCCRVNHMQTGASPVPCPDRGSWEWSSISEHTMRAQLTPSLVPRFNHYAPQ